MPVLKRIGVLSFAKIYGVAGVILGLILGVFMLVLGTAVGTALGVPGIGAAIGALSLVLFPVVYGALFFVLGAISAFLYNVIAERVGGIELEFGGRRKRKK